MKLDVDVLTILSTLEYPSETSVRISAQLDRKAYLKVNKALEALGGKWSRKERAHVFGSDARSRIDYAITTGEVETGQDVGHFPTPVLLAKRLVEMADVRRHHHVLEPSAGTGRIVDAIMATGATAYAIERNPDRQRALVGRCNVKVDVEDFMGYEPDGPYDRVVMNPPFCRVGRGDHLDHVRHAYSMLVEGGILVSVLPASVLFRQDRRYREFRDWWAETGGSLELLPSGSFKESKTGVETVVARLVAVSVD